MTRDQWAALAKQHPGRRIVTTDTGKIVEWPWGNPTIPDGACLWTVVGSGLPWQKFDNDDTNTIMNREWQKATFKKKPRKGGRRADAPGQGKMYPKDERV
jgi:hypothetical protein